MKDLELHIEGMGADFEAVKKGLNEQGEVELEAGGELLTIHFRPLTLPRVEALKLLSVAEKWTLKARLVR